MQKYSSWWRGAPAKGVGRVTGARVRVSPSAPEKAQGFFLCAFSFCIYEFVWRDSNSSSVFLRSKKGHKINCSQSEHDGLKTRRVSPSAPGKVSGFYPVPFFLYNAKRAERLELFVRLFAENSLPCKGRWVAVRQAGGIFSKNRFQKESASLFNPSVIFDDSSLYKGA